MNRVVEVFRTIQGEGSKVGQPAVFVRLSGCNMWSGHETRRPFGHGVCAAWCDTVFHTGTMMNSHDLLDKIRSLFMENGKRPFVVFTGGEPALQLAGLRPVCESLISDGVETAIETNGSIPIPAGMFHHITVSPKSHRLYRETFQNIVQRTGTDLKITVPSGVPLEAMEELGRGFEHRFIQPIDVSDKGVGNLDVAIQVAERLGWRVSVQIHKFLNLP